jgi:lysyl-tRNA synthetase, class I
MTAVQTKTFTAEDAKNAKSWPFQEAARLIKRMERVKKDGPVVFETGYGPSGLPHIGTFQEVARTTMVRRAFELLTGAETKLISFSDDMDGLRKVPPNVPNQELLQGYCEIGDPNGGWKQFGTPVSDIPDPFGCCESFAAHNNNKLRSFLDNFGFEYEFISAAQQYRSGAFDPAIKLVLEKYDEIRGIVLPTLGAERQNTYSPILPIGNHDGLGNHTARKQVIHSARIVEKGNGNGYVVLQSFDQSGAPIGDPFEHNILSGGCKLQWKVDWGMRWFALGVDYEMAGEDLTESTKLSSRIVRALGGTPPEGFNYQLFLDEHGKKISKSKGNGITIDEWLTYASPESLSLYVFQSPKKAKKLYFDVIPKTVDEYWTFVEKYKDQEGAKALDNPVWHVHEGSPPADTPPVSFALLLNLVSASGSADAELLHGFVKKYRPDARPEELAATDAMIKFAGRYFDDFIKPHKKFRAPNDVERAALEFLSAHLKELGDDREEGEYQTAVFDAGKTQNYENIRDWFKGLYEVVFGQTEGPRMGAFTKIFGATELAKRIDEALARE